MFYKMNLTEDQLRQVKELAYRTIPPRMIAISAEVDELEFIESISTPGTPARRAFMAGMLQQMVETREAVIKAAHNGSNPAQSELLKFLREQIYAMNK